MTPAVGGASTTIMNAATTVAAGAATGGGRLFAAGAAGTVGVAVTGLSLWRDSVGAHANKESSGTFGLTMIAVWGGAALFAGGDKIAGSSLALQRAARGAGGALMLGALGGAVLGAVTTLNNPLDRRADTTPVSTQSQAPRTYAQGLPPAPEHLEGMQLATGTVIGKDRYPQRVGVYVEPTSAKLAPAGSSLGVAIGHARAASQSDDQDRSHAVLKTADGKLWIARLTGDLDQLDGRNFSKDTGFDARYPVTINRQQATLQALAGVERLFVFPEGSDATAPAQDPGEIPWVTPKLTPPPPTPPAPAPAPAATPPVAPAAAGTPR